MESNEARIRIGIGGINDVRSALRMLRGEFGGLDGMLKGVASGFVRMGVDVAKAATGLKAIDFGAAADSYKKLDDNLTRMATRGGKNLDEMKLKFKDFARQAGVGTAEFANATKAFDRGTFSGIDDAAEAMRSLGAYAEDTDRSLEDMVEVGADLYTKIGLPASQIGAELRKIQTIASNTGLATGFLGLEDSMRRLLPLMAKFQGGPTRATATVATIQKQGYGKAAAEDITSRIFGPIGEESEHLIRQAAKSAGFKGDPIVATPSGPNKGMPMVSKGGLKALQKYIKGKPLYGVGMYFGGGMGGVEAARAFRRLNIDQIDREEDSANLVEDIRAVEEENAQKAAQHAGEGRGVPGGISGANVLFGATRKRSKFSSTEAGKDKLRAVAREELESGIGKGLVGSQRRLAGQLTTGEAAAAGTTAAYMPGPIQDGIHGAAALAANSKEIAGALRGLTGAIDSLPGKVQAGAKAGVAEGAKRPGIGELFPEKNKANVGGY